MQDPGFHTGSRLSPSPPRKKTRLCRRQRPRMVFSAQQLRVLEEFFDGKPYGTYEERETLAARLNLQEDQVKVWLKNRRAKEQRLQRLRKQQGQGAQAAPQELAVCAPQPVPAPSYADPASQERPLLPASPVLPAIPVRPKEPVGLVYGSFPPHRHLQVFPATDPNASSYSQTCCDPFPSGGSLE
ncbi:tetra-peptide repeat homeobox-like protein [Myotis yumanensis]|uniref:tetra-peptide repeat homeobox-like protein n=1 Tax=Myotis yumanensis TaxID=159337 RepID=UPI0038D4C1BE